MNGREGVMLRQVCDPPSSQEEGTSSDAREQKRQSLRQRAWRQANKVGNPCPHRCGFYLPTDRTYGAALSTHERACPKVRGA